MHNGTCNGCKSETLIANGSGLCSDCMLDRFHLETDRERIAAIAIRNVKRFANKSRKPIGGYNFK